MQTKTYAVIGLSCIDCADRVRAAVNRVDGVRDSHVDHAAGTLTVSTAAPGLTEQIARAVNSAGYRIVTASGLESRPAKGFTRFVFSKRETAATVVAGLVTLSGLVALALGAASWLPTGLLAIAVAIGGTPLIRSAYQELWLSHRLGINVLMVIAVSGAMVIGEWAEAAIVVVLFSFGEALEGYSTERARGALASLVSLAPPVALRLRPDGKTTEVAVEELSVGDLVLVRPGDRIAVDGTVVEGTSAVDQATITGESVPVDKEAGDAVYAGTVNTFGALRVEVTRGVEDSTLSRMVEMVQEAQSRQAPIQRFVDRFASIYTPGVAIAALLVATLPPLVFGQPFWGDAGWLMRALQMLVIACPCALVISTPVSLVSAMTNAASHGVLIKGGRYLEALSNARVFAFDKTGTLTEGRPVVTDVLDVCECGECPEDCGLQHAAAVEVQSSHPLALALVEEARARRIDVPRAFEVAVLSGSGVEGQVNGRNVTVASHAHFDQCFPHSEGVCVLADDLASQGKTVMLVRHDDEVCALFAVADAVRASSHRAISELTEGGGVRTVMLTGDNRGVAEVVGSEVGVDEVHAGLSPEEKVDFIAQLGAENGAVAMVGDGINDAPALARADVGIAMGGAGSAQAMETADVVLMGDDLAQLPFVVGLSRETKRVIAINVAFALVIKALVFALAATGLASLWMAIAADVGASVAVILNGARLRTMKIGSE